MKKKTTDQLTKELAQANSRLEALEATYKLKCLEIDRLKNLLEKATTCLDDIEAVHSEFLRGNRLVDEIYREAREEANHREDY